LERSQRDGKDSVGAHADNEKNLCENSDIASLSLGTTRKFVLENNQDKKQKLMFDLKKW